MTMFDADKNRMIGLPYGEKKLQRYVKPFSSDTERYGHTDRFAISISRVSILTRDKNTQFFDRDTFRGLFNGPVNRTTIFPVKGQRS